MRAPSSPTTPDRPIPIVAWLDSVRLRTWVLITAVVALAAAATAIVSTLLVRSRAGVDDPPVAVAEILDDPAAWIGRQVKVHSQVESVRGPFFTVGGERPDARLLVLAAMERGFTPTITYGDAVEVSGPVRRFDATAFEREFAHSFAAYEDLQGRLVLVARRIDPSVPADGTAGT